MSQPSAAPGPAPEDASVSVLDGITAFSWSDEESVSYEAAVEAIAGLIGACSARIAAQRASGAPDDAVITACKTARAAAAAERARLDPADHTEVARVRAHYADQARRVRAGGA